jgi:hypothetical protein
MREILWQEDHPIESFEEHRADDIEQEVELRFYLERLGQ